MFPTQPTLPNVPEPALEGPASSPTPRPGPKPKRGKPTRPEPNPAVLVRLPRPLIAVLDQIAAQQQIAGHAMAVPRSAVLRLAIDAGLPILGARFGLDIKPPSATIAPDRRAAEARAQLELPPVAKAAPAPAAKPAKPAKGRARARDTRSQPAAPAKKSTRPKPKRGAAPKPVPAKKRPKSKVRRIVAKVRRPH